MPFFRLYHLVFAAAALAAYLTAEELGLVHAWLGYGIAALLLVRLVLGLARRRGLAFRRLMPRPGKAPLNQSAIRHPAIGHALTLALLLCIGGAATTGIAMDRGGTLAGQSIRNHDEEGERDEDGERDGEDQGGPLGELHETFGNLMLPLVLAHLGWLLIFRFDLARYMMFLRRRPITR